VAESRTRLLLISVTRRRLRRSSDWPPLGNGAVRPRRDRQLVQVVHRAARTTAEYVHAVPVYDAHVRVTGDGSRPLTCQSRPRLRLEVEHVRVAEVPCAVVAAVKDHQVLVNDARGFELLCFGSRR